MKTIDTRDLNERKEELEALRDALNGAREARNDAGDNPGSTAEELEKLDDAVKAAEAEFCEEERKELSELEELESEVTEWRDGNTLIPESDFTEYCRKLCGEVGDVPRNLPDYIQIDWVATADNLRSDYSECTLQGETYLYRA